ncbi:MAG: hypothetical protein V7K53_02540 [Nostoc sp.]|uniref:hypothetical protein n=1 Tax=Nostoc sp. TaxID=1180 RepID=UPI002FF8D14F
MNKSVSKTTPWYFRTLESWINEFHAWNYRSLPLNFCRRDSTTRVLLAEVPPTMSYMEIVA